MNIYTRIKKLREAKGMTQEQLAEKTGYKTRSAINKIEAGLRDINQSQIVSFANALNVSPAYLMGWEKDSNDNSKNQNILHIPVLGKVAAGIPLEAIEEIEDYEEISKSLSDESEYFALRIRGESMEPKFSDGDVVIIRKQDDVESGEIGVVIINGSDATIKKVMKQDNGIMLIATNQSIYPPKFYDNETIEKLPVKILGKVVELRAKF